MGGTIMEEKVYKLTKGKITENQLKEYWYGVYKYLESHSVLETKHYFGEGIIDIIIE